MADNKSSGSDQWREFVAGRRKGAAQNLREYIAGRRDGATQTFNEFINERRKNGSASAFFDSVAERRKPEGEEASGPALIKAMRKRPGENKIVHDDTAYEEMLARHRKNAKRQEAENRRHAAEVMQRQVEEQQRLMHQAYHGHRRGR